jgi:hypothetical protein
MTPKSPVIFAVLLAIAQTPASVSGQAANHSVGNQQIPPLASSSLAAPQSTSSPIANNDCDGVPCEYPPPRIAVVNPPPTPVPWPLRDRIAWAANLVLALVGYTGVMLAISLLRKIERHTRATEIAAEAAAGSAQAALLNVRAIIDSERPWLMIAVNPSRTIENSFTVMAVNRGRSPAKIIAIAEQIKIAADEAQLPRTPEYKNEKTGAPFVPIILLPGESTAIKSFGRDDVKGICGSVETLRKIQNWEEKIFLYGKILYRDLVALPDQQTHETAWCCWYIHGRQKSGLVTAGPPEYNMHT